MAKKSQKPKRIRKTTAKKSRGPIKKRETKPAKKRKKRTYTRKKKKLAIPKINLLLNILFLTLFIYIIYQSGILQREAKQKDIVSKQSQYSKDSQKPPEKRLQPVKKSATKVSSAKKETTVAKAAKPKTRYQPAPAVKKAAPKEIEKKVTSPTKTQTASKSIPAVVAPLKKTSKVTASKPKLIFVIDDIGNTTHYHQKLEQLGDNVTYAILPKLAYSQYFSKLSLKTGAEVILHLPLESQANLYPGPGLIKTDMSLSQIRKILNADLKTVPYYVGINNHMGSYGTSNIEFMTMLLKEIKAKGIFFLDSRTTTKGIPSEIGKGIDFPVLERDVFLDNIDDKSYIRGQLQELLEIAKNKGYAIAIGHYRPKTLEVLFEEIPKLKKQGFVIVSLSDIRKKIFPE